MVVNLTFEVLTFGEIDEANMVIRGVVSSLQ